MIDAAVPVDTARVTRIRSGVRAAAVVLTAAASLLGCGTGASAPAPGRPGPTAQLLARAEAALGRISTFHLHQTGLDSHGRRMSVSGDFSVPDRMNLTYTEGRASVHLRLVGREAYMKANRPYWRSQGLASSAGPLAGRWVRLPAASMPGLGVFEAYTRRSTIGRCLIGTNLGTVTIVGGATVDGTQAIMLSARGDTPGSAPGHFYIAATSGLPLRAIQTGPARPGGTPDRTCGETQAPTASAGPSIVDISRYDRPVQIRPPAGAIGLGALRTKLLASTPGSIPAAGVAASTARAQATAMTGSWLVTGRIVATHNFAGLHAGMIYHRIWRIASTCAGGRCGVYLARTSNAGVLAAQLHWTAGHWAATFVSRSLCSDGTTAPDVAQWTLGLSGSGLTAIEHTRGGGTCGPVATEVVVWQAQRLLAAPGSAAIS